MMYIILNFAAVGILILLTRFIDKNLKNVSSQMSSLVVAVLLLTIEAGIFAVTLLVNPYLISSMTHMLLKLLFMIEAVFFITLFFSFIQIGLNRGSGLLMAFRIIAYAIGITLVLTKFKTFELTAEKGIYIGSGFLFNGLARTVFPWTWVTLYNLVFRIVLPVMGCFIMFILREKNATALQNYQAILITEALIVMCALNMFFKFVSGSEPAFSFLYLYSYIAFFVLVYSAFRKTSVPSGRGVMMNILRAIAAYVFPALLVSAIFVFLKRFDKPGFGIFELSVIAGSSLTVLFSWVIWDWVMKSSAAATNDYEANFEKALASIDYAGEMDVVTERMFSVFKNNVECSSLSILLDNGHGVLAPAYSSNASKYTIPVNSKVFDILLNVQRNVVIYSEIDDQHDYDAIREPLKEIFEEGKFDAMIILNEGHNIVGVITLGKKISGDHYKEYDKNAFEKLYSYFFVFGFYVRNISNKEVLSTVNRELRMSSQIITSIQENIDHIRSNKADVGYMMVAAHNIGGEFIDLVRLTDTRHLLVVGDLSGKGIAASMNMVILKSIIRTYLAETHDFKKLVAKVNVFIRESLKKGTIFAGLFALIDFETDTMYYINCGIPAMFMYTQVYNNVIEIQGSGHILGYAKDITPYISVKTTKLNRGDIIMTCTDGLISSHSLRGEKFGRERVSQALLDNYTYPAQRMAQFTYEGLTKFMSKELEDDVSIFVLKYKTAAEFATPEELARAKAEKEETVEQIPEETEETETEGIVTEQAVSEEKPADQRTPEEIAASLMASGGFELPEGFEAFTSSEPETPAEPEFPQEFNMELPQDATEAEGEEVGPVPEFNPEPEVPQEDKIALPEDDFFVEDISKDTPKKDGDFDFDPTAFGLPADFEL